MKALNTYPIRIKVPIFSTRSIGIANYRTNYPWLKVIITYKTQDGKKMFPKPFFIKGSDVRKYPRDKRKPFLHVVPIVDLEPGPVESSDSHPLAGSGNG